MSIRVYNKTPTTHKPENPQGSVICPRILNVLVNDPEMEITDSLTDVTQYADDRIVVPRGEHQVNQKMTAKQN